MSSTHAKRARLRGAAGRVLARAASAVPKSGHGPSSAATRSMSAGVFPPTSSRSTRRRTSTRAPEFAGYSGLQKWCPSGSARHFRDGGGAGQIAPLARMGGLTVRGPTVRLRVPGSSPSAHPLVLPELTLSLFRARSRLARKPTLSPPQAHPVFPPKPTRPPSRRLKPPCSPKPTLAARAPQFCADSSPRRSRALSLVPSRAPAPAGNTRSLAAYLARYGEHGSHLRGLMRMNDPCPGNVLI